MPTTDDIMAALATVPDPEMPISIVDLGLVEDVHVDADSVTVVLTPTFVGCPALSMIEDDVRAKLEALPGVGRVTVRFVHDPPWSVDRITEAGRASLREHGVTVPQRGVETGTVALQTSAVPCPFCNSTSTQLESPFGPTRCRMIHYCNACRNTFERMKRVE